MGKTISSRAIGSRGGEVRLGWLLLAGLLLVGATLLARYQPPYPRPAQPFAERTLFNQLVYPIEHNAGLHLPSAPGALYSVIYAEQARVLWAMGAGGAIVMSRDGGVSWTSQRSGVTADIRSAHAESMGRRLWAVGDGGTILSSDDGGANWSLRTSGVTADLRSVHADNKGGRVWVVGEGGTILGSDDGGENWTLRKIGVAADLWSVHAESTGGKVWAVGDGGTILSSEDGGMSWTLRKSGVMANLRSVVADSKSGWVWAVGDEGTILSSENGGVSWVSRASGVTEGFRSVSVDSAGGRVCAAGQMGVIVSSEDRGVSWASRTSGVKADLRSVFADSKSGWVWAVGEGGTILNSEDGCVSWASRTSGRSAVLFAAHTDETGKRLWAVGERGTIVRSEDGGASWTLLESGVIAMLWSVHANHKGERVWAVGDGGTILSSVDGGASWTQRKSGVAAGLWSVHADSTGGRVWAVGSDGTILSSEDGGESWIQRKSGVAMTLWSVHADSTGGRVWAVGDGGTILSSADGGASWTQRKSGVSAGLWSVHADSTGGRVWAVGSGGTILSSEDGGASWIRRPSPVMATLYSIRMAADDQHGLVGGAAGVVLWTQDGADTWTLIDSKVGSSRLGVIINDKGTRAWAVGYPPAMVSTQDGGQTWTPELSPIAYARYPAPWYYLSLAVVLGSVWIAFIQGGGAHQEGAASVGASDAPTGDFTRDRLQFGPLARGISRFLRNERTEPPMTLAISGDWGSGKSSLMELVCCDLRRFGCRPVWFNAWHHQDEEQLLSSLLSTIRDRALPSVASLDGWIFRARLLWIRSKKHFVIAFICLVALSALVTYLFAHDAGDWAVLWAYVTQYVPLLDGMHKGSTASITTGNVGRILGQLASGVTAFVALHRALKAFGADPAVLMTATAEKFRLKDASAQTSFRTTFAEQFGEVTEALPYRMVIVIDDLDRCKPEAMLSVMEAVNFLVSSGQCFVLFGMATSRVQAALALSFEKISKEMIELDVRRIGHGTQEEEQTERSRRWIYAQDYLEKLINLEITVPRRSDVPAVDLLDLSVEDARGQSVALWKRVCTLMPVLFGLVAIGVGVIIGKEARLPVTRQAPVVTPAPPGPKNVVVGPGRVAFSSVSRSADIQRYVPEMQRPSENPLAGQVPYVVSLGILLLAAGYSVLRLRRNLRSVQDSGEFKRALQIWLPLVQTKRETPRSIKRFGNRLRYLAMLQQGEELDKSRFDQAFHKVANWLLRGDKINVVTAGSPRLKDHRLVALAVIHDVFGDRWKEVLSQPEIDWEAFLDQDKGEPSPMQRLRTAIMDYSESLSVPWPPEPEEIFVFERALTGIRLPGDGDVLQSGRSEYGASVVV